MVKGQEGTAVGTEAGGGGSDIDLSGYVSLPFLRSITWWGRALPADSTDIVGALTGVTDITMNGAITGTTSLTMTGAISGATGLTMNNGAISGATTITASGLATVGSLRIGDAILEWDNGNNALKIRKSTGANDAVNVYATGGVSALGYASGGGGGGATALTDLVDVATNSPSSGQGLVYDATAGKWKNATLFTAMSYQNSVLSVTVSGVTKQVTINSGGGGTGTVTSITAGTGLSGGTITDSGTIAISSTYQTYISHGEAAYGWGNHANAGYLTSSDLTGYATQQWVGQQGYITSSAISDMATQTWVGNNYLPLSGGTMTGALHMGSQVGSSPYIYFGDGSYVYLREDSDDHLKIYGSKGIELTTGSGYNLTWNGVTVATQTWVSQNTVTSDAIADMATKTWVGQQSYATQTWVGQQGYLTSSSLNGYATQTWVGNNYLSIAFFSRLFQAKNGSTNVNPNNTTSTIDSIKAMFGFWTDQYLSALGQSSGGSGGSTALTDLVDVATSNVSNGQGLVYDSTSTKWKNATLFTAMSYQNSVLSVTVSGVTKQVTINGGGGGATTLAGLTDTNISSPSSGQALIYNGSKWANSAINLTLGGLSNVVLSSPTNGQVLKYNGTNWVNGTGGGGGATTLADLTDVSVSGASGGEVLAYNSSTQKWENMAGYMEETGNTSMSGYFEPSSNGGAQLGRSSWRFSYMYGQHGDFSSDLIIGSIKLTYDSVNNALKVQKTDGTAANLYALGSVSALGFGGGPSSTSISELTITSKLKIQGGNYTNTISTDTSSGELYIGSDDGIALDGNVSTYGYQITTAGGHILLGGGRLYLDATRYIYGSGTHLYFYNGSTTITLA